MKAAKHPFQQDRLRALYSYEILDTDPEADFDDIVKLASAICGTAISVVNLIDADRQWFKAETGLGVRETPLDSSICSHVILEQEFVEINDTLNDARLSDNPLCLGDPGLRFYAGAQLVTDDGLPLGTLCVLDYETKRLNELQRDALRVLARQVMAQLDLRKSLKHEQLLRQEVDHRVKNSLQSLSAFTRLQSAAASSDETARVIEQVQQRISAVATLHEQLYRTGAGPTVDLKAYLDNLGGHFAAIGPENVTLEVLAEPVQVTSQQAVAVGTLVNEFVANSFKHAFPDGQAGRIEVSVGWAPNGRVCVSCRDDGVGLPDKLARRTGGLGMSIAEVVCAELFGDMELDTASPGLGVTFCFDGAAAEVG